MMQIHICTFMCEFGSECCLFSFSSVKTMEMWKYFKDLSKVDEKVRIKQ